MGISYPKKLVDGSLMTDGVGNFITAEQLSAELAIHRDTEALLMDIGESAVEPLVDIQG